MAEDREVTPQTFEDVLAIHFHECDYIDADNVRAAIVDAHQRELAEARAETWREALAFLLSQPCPEWVGATVLREFERRAKGEKP